MLREFDVDSVVHRHDPLVHRVSVMGKELVDWIHALFNHMAA